MSTHTHIPIWRDPSYSSKARVAHWLFGKVGQGNVFTKSEMRGAIPGVEQVDRRMRDLRELGWAIKTYREMPTLRSNELYLAKVGSRIWEGS